MRPVLRLGVWLLVTSVSVVLACEQVRPEPEPTPHVPLGPASFAPGAPREVAPARAAESPATIPSSKVEAVASVALPVPPSTTTQLDLRRLVVSGAIKDKEPVPMVGLKVNDPVVAFLELGNSNPAGVVVQVVFQHETGHEVGFVKLEVPAGKVRWRTWAQTEMIKQPGKWTAIVRGADGVELGQQGFFVSPT